MPNIKKTKKVKKLTNLPTQVKTTKSQSTHDYYCCCAEKTKQGMPQGVKISQLTQTCKKEAGQLRLAKQKTREQEKKKILANWKQIGLSLGKIIDHA